MSGSVYKGDYFTKELKENDHFMVIFLYSFVKFHSKKMWVPQCDCVIFNTCYNEVFYKRTSLYLG